MKLIEVTSNQYKRRLTKEVKRVLEAGNGAYYSGDRFTQVKFAQGRLWVRFLIPHVSQSNWRVVIYNDSLRDCNGKQIVASRSVR